MSADHRGPRGPPVDTAACRGGLDVSTRPARLRFTVTLEATGDAAHAERQLARMLKHALRSCGLRAIDYRRADETPPQLTPETEPE